MAAPIHMLTIARAAQILHEDEQLLWDLADDMAVYQVFASSPNLAPMVG